MLLLLIDLPTVDVGALHRLALQFAMAALAGSCVIREDHALARFLTRRWVKRIGVISYGMYLYHVSVLQVGNGVLTHLGIDAPVLSFGLCLAGTIAVAEISFRFFEQPILALKRHFR